MDFVTLRWRTTTMSRTSISTPVVRVASASTTSFILICTQTDPAITSKNYKVSRSQLPGTVSVPSKAGKRELQCALDETNDGLATFRSIIDQVSSNADEDCRRLINEVKKYHRQFKPFSQAAHRAITNAKNLAKNLAATKAKSTSEIHTLKENLKLVR
mmetsp:Transcript_44954/g.45559  ORF Transcript_44954/g.45559 Transcript_44954/m.45559 type:complete len:158 (-) Transcript_44954:28-501(-)